MITSVRSRRYDRAPAIVTGVAVAAGILLLLSSRVAGVDIGAEPYKTTYQFLLVTIVGAAVTGMYQAVAFARELRERRRQFQRDVHDHLVSSYNDAKRARRMLRARAITPSEESTLISGPAVHLDEYAQQMETISDAQLSLELAIRRVEANRPLFSAPSRLIDELERGEKYLNSLVDEYEALQLPSSTKNVSLATVPGLRHFLEPFHESGPFRDSFKDPFGRAMKLLEFEIGAG
jgi:hypothetical protein